MPDSDLVDGEPEGDKPEGCGYMKLNFTIHNPSVQHMKHLCLTHIIPGVKNAFDKFHIFTFNRRC